MNELSNKKEKLIKENILRRPFLWSLVIMLIAITITFIPMQKMFTGILD